MICDLKINKKQPQTLVCQKNMTTMTIRLAPKRGRIHVGTMITNTSTFMDPPSTLLFGK